MKYLSMAALLMAGVAFTSCSSDDDAIAEPQQSENAGPKTYTLTIQAGKGGDVAGVGGTRALDFNGDGELTPYWAEGETVTARNITKNADLGGELTVQETDNNYLTKLSGTLSGTIEINDVLMLKFKSASYASQNGTLDYIADNCDYAIAYVKVTGVDGSSVSVKDCDAEGVISGNSNVIFYNQQAIVKFTLTNATSTLGVRAVDAEDKDIFNYTITYKNNGSSYVYYVALPEISSKKMILTAGDKTLTRSSVSLSNGQYYEISVNL